MTYSVCHDLLTAITDVDSIQNPSRRPIHIHTYIVRENLPSPIHHEELCQVFHSEGVTASRQECHDIHSHRGLEELLNILNIDKLFGDRRGLQTNDPSLRFTLDILRQTRIATSRGNNLHPAGEALRQHREDRLGILPIRLLEVGILVESVDDEDERLGNSTGAARRCRLTQQFMELYRPTPLRHVFDVLVPKDIPKLRAHDQRKTLPVVPVATDAANKEGHDVHVIRRIQGEGGHECSLAADHTGFQGVPGVLGASYEHFQLRYFLLPILQGVWSEIADYFNMIINNVIYL